MYCSRRCRSISQGRRRARCAVVYACCLRCQTLEARPAKKRRRHCFPTKKEAAREWYLAHRKEQIAASKTYKQAHAEQTRAYQNAYRKANIVNVAGIYVNRKTDPPEVVAIAERIRETKTLLADIEGGSSVPEAR